LRPQPSHTYSDPGLIYTAHMQITVFGASGKVGSLVVEEGLRRGYSVTAFVHSHSPFSPNDKLLLVKGDVYNAVDVAKAVRGSDAVISCLSSWGAPGHNVLSSAMEHIVPAMAEQGITRLVSLTGIGVSQNPGRLQRTALGLLGGLPAAKVFQDAQKHLNLLVASSLDWTVVCSPVMNNRGDAGYHLSLRTGFPAVTVSRASVAAALLDQIGDTTYLRQTPVMHRN
jgi:putative NADH-flavin reductase